MASGKRKCDYCQYILSADGHVQQTLACRGCQKKKYTGTNNTFYPEGCPAIMQDGRFITYFNSSHELTESMRKMNGFKSSNQFRNFMQSNGELFMDSERKYHDKNNRCRSKVACSEGYHDLWTTQCGDWARPNREFGMLNN